jgi:hypothetical protein
MKAGSFTTPNFDPITLAVSRWKALWDSHIACNTQEQLEKAGWMKNAIEFWNLTNIFLASDLKETVSKASDNSSVDGMEEIHSLLEKFEGINL